LFADEQINELNWRYLFDESLNEIKDNGLIYGAKSISSSCEYEIRVRTLFNRPLKFPLTDGICSRLICEYGRPLSHTNKYEFSGAKLVNSAWEISSDRIDLAESFQNSIRSLTFNELDLNQSNLSSHFDLKFEKLILFDRCSQPKIYNFDRELIVYRATVIVFAPSTCIGGRYRFIDDNENTHRHVFQRNSNENHSFAIVVPSDCEHEIGPIDKGFGVLLIFHLISKENQSIDDFYSLFSTNESNSIEKFFLKKRLMRLLSYWQNHLDRLPKKLIIPIQEPFDYSSYYSTLFRQKYRRFFDALFSTIRSIGLFFVYSCSLRMSSTRFFIDKLKFLTKTSQFHLDFPSEHQRTILPTEFLGELRLYNERFDEEPCQFDAILLIPIINQWDLLIENPSDVYHHLSFMLSKECFDENSVNLLECFLADESKKISSFEKLIELMNRLKSIDKMMELLKLLFMRQDFQEDFFENKRLIRPINELINKCRHISEFSHEFLDFYRQCLSQSIPTKLDDIVEFLLQLENQTYRCLLINIFLRFILRKRLIPRQIIFSTLCSIFSLLIIDQSYSTDCLLKFAYYLIKRVRSNSSLIYLKSYLIPMICRIYRHLTDFPPAFFLLYQFSLNYLQTFQPEPQSPINIITTIESNLLCPCPYCQQLKHFLLDSSNLTLTYPTSTLNQCLARTLQSFQMLSIEYNQTQVTISKSSTQQQQQQLSCYLYHVLLNLEKLTK